MDHVEKAPAVKINPINKSQACCSRKNVIPFKHGCIAWVDAEMLQWHQDLLYV